MPAPQRTPRPRSVPHGIPRLRPSVPVAALASFLLLLLWAPPSPAGPDTPILRTWEEFDAATLIEYDKPSGTRFLEGAEVLEIANAGLCSGSHFLAKRIIPTGTGTGTGTGNGNGKTPQPDPGPLTLLFDSPRSFVGLCVGNPEGKQPREISLLGYDSANATKPVAVARVVLPGGTPISQRITLCRMLDRDLVRVELHYGDEGVEYLDDLQSGTATGMASHISFEEHPAGTLIESQYPGVTFPTRPELVASTALGVGTHSESQALRQRVAGESDPGPMILDFAPSQGAIRVRTGYPPAEKQSGPLRVRLRALAAHGQGHVLVASDEVEIPHSQAITRTLEVCRLEGDIVRIEIEFDSSFGGHEVIDDLQFGPNPVPTPTDTGAPRITIESPADNTRLDQPTSRPEHRTTPVTLRGVIEEDRALNSFRVQVLDAGGNVRFDDGERLGVVTGVAPNFRFETPVLLEYGASTVRLTAIDAAGNTTRLDHHLSYLGPPPLEVTGTSPGLALAPIIFREASTTGPALSNAPTVVRLTGRHIHPETRFYLVPESRSDLPPSAPDLIDVPPAWRSADQTEVDLPIPDFLFRAPGRYVWIVWDLWGRPGRNEWTHAGTFEARAWPQAALGSIGFRNRDERNDIGDFEGVYGEEVLPDFLEPATPIDDCRRGANAINFFLGRYLPTLNAPRAGGSCFGFAAVSQFFRNGLWRTEGFDPAVHLPAGFRAAEPMRFTSANCRPQVPANLWAQIQTMFGVHTSYEFLNVWADQADDLSNGAMSGNPLRVADLIRDYPAGYVLGFTPFTSNVGHAVAPYRVENRGADTVRIWVIDSNFPYDPAQAEDALPNRAAVNRFIDIDRRSNTFRFSLSATSDPALEYQTTNRMTGSALVAVPMSVFTNPRTIPMTDYLAEQYFGITGDVEPELEIEGHGSWGWDESGDFHGRLQGLRVVPSFDGGDPGTGNPLLLLPTNAPRFTVSLGGKDPTHHLVTGNGGIVFGARRTDRTPATKDLYQFTSDAGRPRSLRFLPGSPAGSWTPELGLVLPNDGELLFRLHHLQLEAGQPVQIEALPSERGLRVRNESSKPIAFHLELSTGNRKPSWDNRWFGPFLLPAGAALDLVPARWPAIDTLDARLDEDSDGVPESVAPAPGLPIDLKPGDTGDCNRNGLLDAVDIARGTSVDANLDGIPDECPPPDNGGNGNAGGGGGSGSGGGGKGECPPAGEHLIAFDTLANGPVPAEALGAASLLGSAEIRDGRLASVPSADLGSPDTGTLSLRFACPRGSVTLGVVNPGKSGSLRARAWAYSATDSTKPVAEAVATVPAGSDGTVPLMLCRPLEQDIGLVVLEFDSVTPETLRSITHSTRANHQVQRLDFEDRPPGTLVFGHYPGVTFPDRPRITLAEGLGVAAGSGTRVLRKVPNDLDPGPLTLGFDPPQAEVRVMVGYPVTENDGRPLRVALRAYDATKGNPAPIATVETVINAPRAISRILGLKRCQADIHRLEIQFLDRALGGLEAIDDLEFGPVPVGSTEPDTTAPVLRMLSPAQGAEIQQFDPLQSTGGTNLVLEITEDRALDRVVVIVRDATGAEFRRLDDSTLRLTGTAPRFRLEAVLPLAYGRNTVEVQAVDTSGNAASTASDPLVITYRGPAPLVLASATPAVGYPEDLVREAHNRRPAEFPEIKLPSTVFTLVGSNFNRLVRVFAVRDDLARIPPAPVNLIPAEIVARDAAGTNLQVRLPAGVWADLDISTDKPLRWIVEDAWTRPDRVTWTLGDRFIARQRPWPMTYGFGFLNVEGPNSLTDFDGVFRHNAYTAWSNRCWRDLIYLGFYEWGYSVTLNRSPGGSCFGYAAASQALYLGDFDPAWLNSGFIDVVRLPSGRSETGQIRENNPSCGPRSPASLWSWIQTYHGMQQSEEHLLQQLNQIVQRGGIWRGNVGARLAQLGTRPYAYLLCMKPRSETTGHCVLPYRVEPLDGGITRIWVYDPNYPYYHSLPETHPANVRSVYSYVDVNPAANNYTFDVDASFDTNNVALVRNHYHAGRQWSGEGLSVTLLPTGDRTMPGLGYGISYLFASVAGDARPLYSNSQGKRWGWSPEGKLVQEMDDIHPFTPFTFAGDETDQVNLLTRPSNTWSHLEIQVRGTNYQFATGGGGVILGLRNPDASPGTVDHAEQRLVDGTPRAIRFESERPNTALEPFVILPETPGNRTHHVAWHWQDLRLPAGSPIVFEADATTGALGARNEGGTVLSARLIRDGSGPEGPESIDYGPVTLPPGATVRLTPSGPPQSPHLREEIDSDGDGTFERVADRLPGVGPSQEPPRLVPVRADHARKKLRLRIHGAAPADIAVERSRDLSRWESVETEPATDDVREVECDLNAGSDAAFFRLRRIR